MAEKRETHLINIGARMHLTYNDIYPKINLSKVFALLKSEILKSFDRTDSEGFMLKLESISITIVEAK